jgi:hypothetical protein
MEEETMKRARFAARLSAVALLVGIVSVGMGQLMAARPRPGPGPCPSPAPGCFCATIYAPVRCGPNNCQYSNQCFAGCAGWAPSACTQIGGPVPI